MNCFSPALLFALVAALLCQGTDCFAEEGKPSVPLQARTKQVDPARIEITPSGKIHAGEIGPKGKKSLAYLFHNTSNAPITLTLIDTMPGTTVEGPALMGPIPPHGKASLTMHIDANNAVGYQRRNAKFITDDPRQGNYMLPVELVVRPDLTVDAERKGFGKVAPDESPALRFTFKRETEMPLTVKVTNTLPSYLTYTMDNKKHVAHLQLLLRPSLIAPGVRRGLEIIKIDTNAPQQPHFTLYVDWNLHPPIEADPCRVVFLDPKVTQQTLTLKDDKDKAFCIRSAQLQGEGFALGDVPKTKASTQRITVMRTAQKECKAMLQLVFEGIEAPLNVPLSYLPPSQTPAKKAK